MAKLSETFTVNPKKKLSETFTIGGGVETAPTQTPLTNNQNKKLSETFTIGKSVPFPKLNTPKEEPKPVEPMGGNLEIQKRKAELAKEAQAKIPKVEEKAPGFWETVLSVATGIDPSAPSNISAGYSQAVAKDTHDTVKKNVAKQNYLNTTRQKELSEFDSKDTSKVLYQNGANKVTEAKLNMWLDPSYELSNAEKKQAKEVTKVLLNAKNYKQYFGNMDSKEAGKLYQSISELGLKTSAGQQMGRGIAEAIPGVKAIERGTARLLDKANGDTHVSDQLKNEAKMIENTGAYQVGKAASKIGQYFALNASGVLEPITAKIGGWLSPKVASTITATYNNLGASQTAVNAAVALGESMTNHVANILSDEVADILLDTIPEMADNIRDGMSGKEVASAVLKNLGVNMAYNVGGEIVMNAKDIKNALIGKYNLPEETAEVVAKELPNIVDDVAKEVSGDAPKIKVEEPKVIPEVKPEAEAVAKQMDNTLNNNAPLVDLGGQTVKETNTPIEELKPVQKPVANQPEIKPKNEVMAEDVGLGDTDSNMLEVSYDEINPDRFKPLEPMENTYKIKEEYNPHEASVRESKLFTNTLTKEGLVNMADDIDKRAAQYIKHYNADVLHDAMKDVEKNSASLIEEYMNGSKHIATDGDVDRAMLLLHNIKDKISDAVKKGATVEELEPLRFQYELMKRRLREAETTGGQLIQATAKWNGTAEGAILSGEKTLDKAGREWASKSANAKAVKKIKKTAEDLSNIRVDKALANMGYDGTMAKEAKTLTHEQLEKQVRNSLEKEFASVGQQFTDNDVKVLTSMVEEKTPIDVMTDQLEHRLNHGTWYTLDESIPTATKENPRLKQILSKMLDESEPVAKEPLSREAIREQVRNTLEKELGSIEKFSDADVDYVANLMQTGATSKEISDALQSRIATGAWGVSDETINRVNELMEEASRYAPGSKQRVDAEQQVWQALADDIFKNGSSFAEKLDAFRYIAMLGNPKTQIKNIVSTAEMHMVDGVSNNLAALIEAGAQKMGFKFERTKAIINPASKSDQSLIQNALKDATDNSWAKLTGQGRWGKATDEINRARKVYDSKFMNGVENLSTSGLETADNWFLKQKYATSLAGYLKANGADPKSIFDAEYLLKIAKDKGYSDEVIKPLQAQIDLLNKGREYAIKEAQYATFHAENAIADVIQKFKKNLNTSESAGARTFGKMAEGIIPFVKTPANVLKNTIDFSPISYFKMFNDAKKYGAAKAIDDFAKGTTGLGLMFAGYALADAGFAHGKASDYEQSKGIQDYSFNLFGKSVNVADIMSGNAGFFVGVALHDELAKKGYDFENVMNTMKEEGFLKGIDQVPWNDIFNSMAGMTEPISETSMLTGVTNFINAVKNSDHPVPAAIATLGTNYFTQLVPTVLGQAARSVDNTRRSTFTDDKGAIGSIQKNVEKVQNKIPVLSTTNEPYIDMWGREQKNSPFENPVGRTAYQFGFPAYMGDVDKDDPVFNEVDRLGAVDGIGIDEVTPGSYSSSIGGQRLTQKEYTTYTKATGGARYDGIKTALNNKYYQNLTDTQKAEVIKSIYSLANNIGKNAVTGGGAKEDNPEFKAYYNNGKPDMNKAIDYIVGKLAMTSSGISTSNEDAKAAFDKKGQAGLDAYTGVTAEDREHAQQIIPSLDYTQILNTDKNDVNAKAHVNASTAIPYLRKQKISNSEMGEILYNSGQKDKDAIDVYKNLGYDGVYQYYAMKADASDMNPDGKEGSLDQKEKVVYLYNQGYSLAEINDWLKLLGSKDGISSKKFQDILKESRSWR